MVIVYNVNCNFLLCSVQSHVFHFVTMFLHCVCACVCVCVGGGGGGGGGGGAKRGSNYSMSHSVKF